MNSKLLRHPDLASITRSTDLSLCNQLPLAKPQDYLARSNVPEKLEADLLDPYCPCLNLGPCTWGTVPSFRL